MMSSIGTRHASPNRKRSVRKVNGGAYCKPILVAMKPEPHTVTKYQASAASNQEDRGCTNGLFADPVAPLFLGAVERAVGGFDYRLRGAEAVGALRHPYAYRHRHRVLAAPPAALA